MRTCVVVKLCLSSLVEWVVHALTAKCQGRLLYVFPAFSYTRVAFLEILRAVAVGKYKINPYSCKQVCAICMRNWSYF